LSSWSCTSWPRKRSRDMRRRVPAVPWASRSCIPRPQMMAPALPPATGTNRRPTWLKMARSMAIPASPPRHRPAPRSARAPATATTATHRRRTRASSTPLALARSQASVPETQPLPWVSAGPVVLYCGVPLFCVSLFQILSLIRCNVAVWYLFSIGECIVLWKSLSSNDPNGILMWCVRVPVPAGL
ncbi:hypothetical protein BAE44_0016773, partial [Dichanthelium oligosanthes]